jgi:hypothetical protein
MRAIYRFPLPDSHVSLSAVLEPGPNAQTATPPRPATAQSNLPQNRGRPQPRPIPTDMPRHHDPPRLRSEPLTSLADKPRHPNRCEFETWPAVSETLTRLKYNPHRQSHKTSDLHAPKAHNRRRRQRPLPAIEHQDAPTNSFRPKLQPPLQSGVRPPRYPTDQDYAATLTPPGHWIRHSAFQGALRPAN